jgi:tripartite-type tricarboxylate transporter receptor subunit TctC
MSDGEDMIDKRILMGFACTLFSAAAAAAYPTKPVTIVVPFPGGQTGDIIARAIGEELAQALGQPFIIENRPGAGGTLGTGYAARADNDGYTLLLTSTGPFAIAPSLYSKLAYDPLKDFVPVADIAVTPQVLAVGESTTIHSVKELVEAAKKDPMTYASAGNGSTQHLTMEVFSTATGVTMTHVPFKGSAEAQTQVAGGQIPAISDSLPAILPMIRSGKLRPLAVVDVERSPFLPDVPTLEEEGYASVSTLAFFGMVAPEGTPTEVVDTLNKAINERMKSPEVLARFKTLALSPAKAKTAPEFAAYLADEVAKFKTVVEAAGAQID